MHREQGFSFYTHCFYYAGLLAIFVSIDERIAMAKEFPWFKHYPAGIPNEIGPLEYNSLVELFDAASKKYADRIAYDNLGATITFKEVDRLSTAFGAYLQKELGLKKGDRIAIQMPNLLQFPVAFIGAMKAGLIVVNTNPLYTPREMEHQFKDAGISAVLILDNFASHLESILGKIPAKHIIVTRMGDMMGTLKGMLVNFVVKTVKKMVPAYHIPNAISFKEVIRKGLTPDNELSVAQRQGRLHRNFQGYSTHADLDLFAFGISAIGQVGPTYSQNVKTLDEYYACLDHGTLPVMRGIELTADDLLRRALIQALMCHFEVPIESIEVAHLIDFRKYFEAEIRDLEPLREAGLLTLDDQYLTVTPLGRFFIRNICMVFDRYLREGRERARYSKVV